ncbi:putative sodium-coupled neutral amino acid transporter 10 [Pseudolycoriella hygida]|uniref:Sodium-coupled neutral amino acid transporter 10 n=1 Tax=Pseudolycoriella hygida TaxID=35572 RepID=A0A9Q0RV19_9DIPT|nr:putative sodium-coupled neutral amino acid transporter 10 [Pseudolycoriella hygida]
MGSSKMVYIMTLANSIIGVGILAMPFCFQKCGIILAIVLLVMSNFITRLSCYYLLKSSAICRRRSMEVIAFSIFGSSGKLMVELCVIGYLLGACITYFVVVGDLGPQIIAKIFDLKQTSTLRSYVMIFVTMVCVIPLGLLRNVDSLAAVCTASIGFYFCLVLKIMGESSDKISSGDWVNNVDYWNLSGVLQCLPIFSMALSCQMQLFEVFENVSNVSYDKMNEYVKSATTICTFVYILVGFFGYVAFCTKPFSGNILLNLSPSLASDAIKIGFVLSVAFSFPLMIFPCRASLYSLLYRRGHADVAHYIPEHRFKLITISLVLLALLAGILIPSIELIIGFVGSTIGVAICIMFPASCFIKVCQKNSTEKLLAQVLLIFGFMLMVLGTYANLSAIDEKTSGSFNGREGILKQFEDSVEQSSFNLTKHQSNESPEVQVDQLIVQDVTPSRLDLEDLPNQFDIQPKSPDFQQKVDDLKYHENPVEGLSLQELSKNDAPAQQAPEPEVKIIPLEVAKPTTVDESKKNNDINNEAIQKEEQEIAIEKKEQKEDDSQSELKRLEETKKLLEEVKEIKNVLQKQNQETQQLVLQKFDEIVDKVEKIEKVQEEDNKKHEEEKAGKTLIDEGKTDKDDVAVQKKSDDEKTLMKPVATVNQTENGPVINMLMNKRVQQVEPSLNKSIETNVKKNSKLTEKLEHVPIQRDLLNVNSIDESADQPATTADTKTPLNDLLRRKRNAIAPNDDCPMPILDERINLLDSENKQKS